MPAHTATLLILAALLPVCACRKQQAVEAYGAEVDGQGRATITVQGLRVEVESPVRFVSSSASSTPGESKLTSTIEGHPFGLENGVFFIGPKRYGPAKEGALVRVTTAGVSIDGEHRGALPPAK